MPVCRLIRPILFHCNYLTIISQHALPFYRWVTDFIIAHQSPLPSFVLLKFCHKAPVRTVKDKSKPGREDSV